MNDDGIDPEVLMEALRDDNPHTWIGSPPQPPDIRTWDGLADIIDASESWTPGEDTVEKMKAAGWQPPEDRDVRG